MVSLAGAEKFRTERLVARTWDAEDLPLALELWGDPADSDQVVNRGDLSTASFSTWWLRQGAVVAAFVMRRPEEERDAAQKWIASAQKVSPVSLGNESVPIDSVSTAGARA